MVHDLTKGVASSCNIKLDTELVTNYCSLDLYKGSCGYSAYFPTFEDLKQFSNNLNSFINEQELTLDKTNP